MNRSHTNTLVLFQVVKVRDAGSRAVLMEGVEQHMSVNFYYNFRIRRH